MHEEHGRKNYTSTLSSTMKYQYQMKKKKICIFKKKKIRSFRKCSGFSFGIEPKTFCISRNPAIGPQEFIHAVH